MESTSCLPVKQTTGTRWRRIDGMRDFYRYNIDFDGTLDTDDVLIHAGIDPEAMGYLTGKERREILIRAGLNPKDFDF